MDRNIHLQADEYKAKRKRNRKWQQVVTVMSAIVVFCTTYMLILPAITHEAEPTCGYVEHQHTEDCHQPDEKILECNASAHSHEEDCYNSEGTLICKQTDLLLHEHNDYCRSITGELICSLTETVLNSHTEECYETAKNLICEKEEIVLHSHEEACFDEEERLICEKSELSEHKHSEECYSEAKKLRCTLAESTEHTHSEECYEKSEELICSLDEISLHTHSEECYEENETLICSDEKHLLHAHGEACYDEAKNLICGIAEIAEHAHGPECVRIIENDTLICDREEHTHHEILCYLDPDAVMETPAEWETTLPEKLSENLVEATVAVAESQLGYKESESNSITSGDGQIYGATRYGIWYGDPYGNWDTMFVSFCLYYAGISDEIFPYEANSYRMSMNLSKMGLYVSDEEYEPRVGDPVFFDYNDDGNADHTGIIQKITIDVETEKLSLTVIEGDTADNTVESRTYEIDDIQILGYGKLNEAYEKYLRQLKKPPVIMMAPPAALADSSTSIAKTADYNSNLLSNGGNFLLYTRGSNGNYYAIDGNANAVRIYIDGNGNITTDISNVNSLFWRFEYCNVYENKPSYYIQNVSTNMYLHPYADGSGNGAILSGRWESALHQNGNGVKFQGARQNNYAWLENNRRFTNNGNLNNSSVFYFGKVAGPVTLWFDGTNGGLMAYSGSPNQSRTANEGSTYKLPETWQTPPKYNYTLRGWYDVTNSKYYPPGAEITVTGNTVFYADWVMSSYDIGEYNAFVANTVSTADFITAKVFDYNALFNVLSETVNVSASDTGHSETWSLAQNGTVPYQNGNTLGFIFNDYDGGGDISYPNNRNGQNISGSVFPGIYSDRLGEILFSTENAFDPATVSGIIGKQYLGTADHLFQLNDDPNSEHYGYYYYDSSLNAAAYNQSDGRFYVYDYLERTADSAKDGGGGEFSDFLPFNSPYANTNGKTVVTYNYNGVNNEYPGINHYQYDAKYNTNNNSTANVITNYLFGMSIDMQFFLPDTPGTRDENGYYANLDLNGNQMHFKFSGDDDVWVLIDGKLVLDIGGIHGIESGDINFSTGVVTVNGVQTGTLNGLGLGDGEHTLTIHYLERGSSQSNCAIYFNLAPRYGLNIQKEDVISQQLLNGAEFTVYTDKACTVPAMLWDTKESNQKHEPSKNTFTVENGQVNLWGLGAGKTYYIKESKPPIEEDYSCANGIICLTFDKRGNASYEVEIIDDGSSKVSNGFTVHGYKIDEETQQAYIVITNAQDWVKETTSVQVYKRWEDNKDHSLDYVTIYLTVEDPDGTVRRIREIVLGKENNWEYTWTNLPKYYEDGITEIEYDVQEGYFSGYTSTIEKVNSTTSGEELWAEAYEFKTGETYVLKTSKGCLAAVNGNTESMLHYINEEQALENPLARWVATVNKSGEVLFKNEAGHILSLNYSGNANDCFFRATKNTDNFQTMRYKQATSKGIKIYHQQQWMNVGYYVGTGTNSYGGLLAATEAKALVFTPLTKRVQEIITQTDSFIYKVTNSVLSQRNETSLTVFKEWDLGMATPDLYEQAQVTVKLFANGKDTGRTVTLSLKNGWTQTFMGLPYTDSDGKVIEYTVEESWQTDDWIPFYGNIIYKGGNPGTYEIVITNTYRWGYIFELPATGGMGAYLYTMGGFLLISSAGMILLYNHKKRRKEEG